MLSPLRILLGGLPMAVLALQPLEPAEFDVAAALAGRGIDIAALPLAAFDALSALNQSVGCTLACASLTHIFGASATLQTGQAAYTDFTSSAYWSTIQAAATPSCVFLPSKSDDVGVAVLVSRLTQCQFAVRSGGHASFAGSSSISDGITISLQNFVDVDVSIDNSTVAVGPGNRWSAVYAVLNPMGLAVTGGRAGDVGVGGLTLGGGISFFSNIYGWACDNVISYEVVSAWGVTLTASATENPDLYWALRGGGNNFGIVTSLEFATFPLPGGTIWGGSRYYAAAQLDNVTSAFTELAADAEADLNAGSWATYLTLGSEQLAIVELWYAKPNGGNASAFAQYNAIPSFNDDTKNRQLIDLTTVISADNPAGFRESFYVMTYKNNGGLNSAARDIVLEAAATIDAIPGAFLTTTFQSITVPQMEAMSVRGGNPLGLNPADGPLTLVLVAPRWTSAEYDDQIFTVVSNALNSIKTQAEQRGLQSDYLYMNYASQFQDVISSYGAENKQRLIGVQQAYDPTGVFQTLMPGYFKLNNGPPVSGSGFFDD